MKYFEAVLIGTGIGVGFAFCWWMGHTAIWIKSIAITLMHIRESLRGRQ